MKKILTFLLVVTMVLALCACGVEKQTVQIYYGQEDKIELKKQSDALQWNSSDETIVKVDNGTIVGVAPGKAIITATADGKSIAEVSVSVDLIDIAAVLFSQKVVELKVGEQFQQKYTLLPDNASDYGLSWKSANTEIAEVDAKGTILAVAPGTTTIACSTQNGIIESCEVTVKEPSAIEKLNEYEKRFFDVLVGKVLPSFYKPSAARVKQLGPTVNEEYDKSMILDVRIQGENRMGGTVFKDYMVLCDKEETESTYLPCFTDDGLFKSPHEWKENTKIDISKINLALEEYWKEKGMA